MTKRAKCRLWNSPNGSTALRGSAMPGAVFMPASTSRRSASRPAATVATIMNGDCGVTASELQAKIDEPLFPPVHLAEIELRLDHADLVADPVSYQRRVG